MVVAQNVREPRLMMAGVDQDVAITDSAGGCTPLRG